MNIVLFINGSLGLRVLDYMTELKEHVVVSIFLNSNKKRDHGYMEEVRKLLEYRNLQIPIIPWTLDSSECEESKINFDLPTVGVSALFGHFIPEKMAKNFSKGILNLHPSLLPTGRGADPIPWNIIDKQVQGISIHLIDQELDTGDLVFQREIPSTIDMSAGEIYEIATSELFSVFSDVFPNWMKGDIQTYPQADSGNTSHKSSELESMRIFTEDEVGTFGDFLRRLQATTFSDGRHPSFRDNKGKIWDLTVRISDPHISKK